MNTSFTFRKLALVSASLIGLIGFAEAANAHTLAKSQINARLDRQIVRIERDAAVGKIGRAQETRLLRKEHQIRREERVMASLNGGRLTRAEIIALNQQESQLAKRIP